MTPLLTLGVATHNGSATLAETLDSLVEQCCTGVEILVAENGSTDETLQIARDRAARCDAIRIVTVPEDIGFDRNVARLVNHARTPFVWLLADDDLLRPGAVKAALSIIRRWPDIAVAFLDGRSDGRTDDVLCEAPEQFLNHAQFRFGGMSANLVSRDVWCSMNFSDVIGLGWIHSAFVLRALPGRRSVVSGRSLKMENPSATAKRWDINGRGFLYGLNAVRVYRTMDPAAYSTEFREAAVETIRSAYTIQIPRAKARGLSVDGSLLHEMAALYGSYPSFWLRDVPLLCLPNAFCRFLQKIYRRFRPTLISQWSH